MSNTEKLKKMMEQAAEVFKQVDKVGEALRNNKMSKNIEFYSDNLDILTGCYSYIAPRYYRLAAEHTNGKLAKYMELKVEAVKEEVKFVNAPAEKEAEASVKENRVVRNLFEGYMKSSENAINTCKMQIKRIQGEDKADTNG